MTVVMTAEQRELVIADALSWADRMRKANGWSYDYPLVMAASPEVREVLEDPFLAGRLSEHYIRVDPTADPTTLRSS